MRSVPPSTTIAEPEVTTGSETTLAPRWKVLLLNDDKTTFPFVIELLQQLFHKPHAEAVRLTHEIHNTGSAMVTVTSRERAELYVEQVQSLARPRGFPLTAAIEPE
jgi:ATP-dependent Clp protease adaptor protein ClpS